MTLETALDLIKEAQKIETKRDKGDYYDGSPDDSQTRHDECLRIARRILLEHYYDRH